jgi:hypothetical protein
VSGESYLADGRGAYYARVFHEEIDHGYSRVPKGRRAHAIAVHVMLARHVGGKDRTAFPSLSRLQERTGLSRPTVIDALKELSKAGLIRVEKGSDEGGKKKNVYTLTSPPLVNDVYHPSKSPLPPLVNDVYPKKNHIEEETEKKNSRRGADAPTQPKKKNWFGFFCELANSLQVIVTPEDRRGDLSANLKALVTKHEATDEEMYKVVSKILEARCSGYEMSPQKALGKFRCNNVTPIRPGAQEEPHRRKAVKL